MVDQNLNRYIGGIIDNLKKSNYKVDDIQASFNSFFQNQSKQKGLFIVLCYISSLLLGILISTIIILGSIFFGSSNFVYTIVFIVFIALSFLTYFCFNYFNINEKKILIITMSLSIIISITSWISNFFANKLSYTIQEIFSRGQEPINQGVSSMASLTGNPVSPVVIAIILLLIYNSIPLIFLISKN